MDYKCFLALQAVGSGSGEWQLRLAVLTLGELRTWVALTIHLRWLMGSAVPPSNILKARLFRPSVFALQLRKSEFNKSPLSK